MQSLHRQVKLALDLYADPAVARGAADPLDGRDAGAPARGRAGQRPPAGVGARLRRDGPYAASSWTCWTALLDGTRDHRGPGRRHGAALGVRAAARGDGPLRRGRRSPRELRARHDRRGRAPRGDRPGRAADRGGQGGGVGVGRRVRQAARTPCRRRSSAASSRPTSASCSRRTPRSTSRRSRTSGTRAATRWPSRSRSASTRRSRSPQETLDATDAWLTAAEPNAALRRLVSESRAGVERALRAQAADAAAVAE